MSRPPATTFEYLQFHAANTPDRVALILDDGEVTYGRFADDAQRFTKALADLGIQRRQIVSIHHPHFYIEWLLTIACENLGAVSVSDDARNWKGANYLYQHVDVGLTNSPAEEEPPFRYHCLTLEWVLATLRMDLAVAQKQKLAPLKSSTLVRLAKTSGSTGISKILPQNLGCISIREGHYFKKGQIYKSTKFLIAGNTNLGLSVNYLVCRACFVAGAAAIKTENPKIAIKKCTLIISIPINIEQLINEIVNSDSYNSCIQVEIIGASLDNILTKKIQNTITHDIVNHLGTNEAPYPLKMIRENIGIPKPEVEIEIRDDMHRQVPNGTPGLIAVRTLGMIEGYYKNEEETRKRFHDGWFYTGDAGIMVGPRKVKLLGRADDMVIMGGVKESPLRLEETLRTEPRIRDAAVVGIKASDGGDLVCVALVLNNEADLAEVSAGIRKHWAPYRARIICASMNDLPRTDNGKVSRAKVRELFQKRPEVAQA